MKHIITISDITCGNFDTVVDIVANTGFGGSWTIVDECTREINIGDQGDRAIWGISEQEVHRMIAQLVMYTSCTVRSRVE